MGSCSQALEIYFSVSGSTPEIILLILSLQREGTLCPFSAVFSSVWLCSKEKQNQNKPKQNLPRSLLLKSEKLSIPPYNQEKKMFHCTLFPGIHFGRRNYFKEIFYVSGKLYLNLEKPVRLSDSLIWQLPQIQNAGAVSAHAWVLPEQSIFT